MKIYKATLVVTGHQTLLEGKAPCVKKARVFVIVCHFHRGIIFIIFTGKADAYLNGDHNRTPL